LWNKEDACELWPDIMEFQHHLLETIFQMNSHSKARLPRFSYNWGQRGIRVVTIVGCSFKAWRPIDTRIMWWKCSKILPYNLRTLYLWHGYDEKQIWNCNEIGTQVRRNGSGTLISIHKVQFPIYLQYYLGSTGVVELSHMC